MLHQPSRAGLTRIMHHMARFYMCVDVAGAFNPIGWMGESNSRCNALAIDLPRSATGWALGPAAHGPDGVRPRATVRLAALQPCVVMICPIYLYFATERRSRR
jgi:hypothetical protein